MKQKKSNQLLAETTSELLHAAALTLAKRELAREQYIHYCTYMNDKFEVNWHHCSIADSVDRLFLPLDDPNHLRRLIISMPPRHGKTELLSRILPGYAFMKDPSMDIIFASYSASIAERVSGEARRFLESDKYKTLTDVRLPNSKQKGFSQTREFWQTVSSGSLSGGSFKAVGTGGSLTGSGAQLIICDDLIKDRQAANSPVSREATKNWYTSVLRTRATGDCRIIVLGTMWHASDIINDLINADSDENIPNEEKEHWHKIILPAIAEGQLCPGDPRSQGEVLWPDKYDKKKLNVLKSSLSNSDWSALFQCNPILGGSTEWPTELFNDIYINQLPQISDIVGSVIGIDPALGQSEIGDRSSMCYMSRGHDGKLNCAFLAEQMPVGTLLDHLTEWCRKFHPDCVAVEITGFQQLLLTQIKQRFAAVGCTVPVLGVKQNIKKEVRLRRLGPYIEKGTLKVLGPNKHSKIFVKEAKEFPVGATDDLLDSAEIALRTLISVCNTRTTKNLTVANLGQRIDLPEDLAVRTTTPAPLVTKVSAADYNRQYNIPQPKEPPKKRR